MLTPVTAPTVDSCHYITELQPTVHLKTYAADLLHTTQKDTSDKKPTSHISSHSKAGSQDTKPQGSNLKVQSTPDDVSGYNCYWELQTTKGQ